MKKDRMMLHENQILVAIMAVAYRRDEFVSIKGAAYPVRAAAPEGTGGDRK